MNKGYVTGVLAGLGSDASRTQGAERHGRTNWWFWMQFVALAGIVASGIVFSVTQYESRSDVQDLTARMLMRPTEYFNYCDAKRYGASASDLQRREDRIRNSSEGLSFVDPSSGNVRPYSASEELPCDSHSLPNFDESQLRNRLVKVYKLAWGAALAFGLSVSVCLLSMLLCYRRASR
jgi:hypothetical protein